MTTEPNKNVIEVWTHLVSAQHKALSHIEAALKAANLPALSWYDVLLELDRVGKDGMRPYELEQSLLLPQYSLSRLLDRIASAGYLNRLPCKQDARGQIIAITCKGKEIRQRMWPVYEQAINQSIAKHLTTSETESLSKLLGKLIEP